MKKAASIFLKSRKFITAWFDNKCVATPVVLPKKILQYNRSRLIVQCWWKTKKININILIAKGRPSAILAAPLHTFRYFVNLKKTATFQNLRILQKQRKETKSQIIFIQLESYYSFIDNHIRGSTFSHLLSCSYCSTEAIFSNAISTIRRYEMQTQNVASRNNL